MYTFKMYKDNNKELLNGPFYSIFMEEEKIVLGLFKEKFSKKFHKHFEKDYIVLGELNLEEMENYSYDSFSNRVTIEFETEYILETLKSLKPLFPLYIKGEFKDIRNETFFLFNIESDIIGFLQESLRIKYNTDFSLFNLKELELYDVTNIFTYSVDCCAGISKYLKFQFQRYSNEININEDLASKALLNLLNKELVEGGDEPLDEDVKFNLTRVNGFNNLYEVFKECYASYLRKDAKYEESFKVITNSDKHEKFVLDLEKVLREINILDNVEKNNDLLVFNCNEEVDTECQ